MNAVAQRTTPHLLQGARIALACAAAALLAACGELSATTSASEPPVTHDVADNAKADRAGNGTWNHNAGDVRVMSGTGRQVLR